jgi:hypothetical protein
MSGLEPLGRYAFPPTIPSYCGPADSGLTEGLADAEASKGLAHVVQRFEGLWPYLAEVHER